MHEYRWMNQSNNDFKPFQLHDDYLEYFPPWYLQIDFFYNNHLQQKVNAFQIYKFKTKFLSSIITPPKSYPDWGLNCVSPICYLNFSEVQVLRMLSHNHSRLYLSTIVQFCHITSSPFEFRDSDWIISIFPTTRRDKRLDWSTIFCKTHQSFIFQPDSQPLSIRRKSPIASDFS